jgi:hypothetical protein
MSAWTIAFGLGFSPADRDQKDAVRIMYAHVPTVWVAYLAFVVTAACSALYPFGKRHSLGFDRFAGVSADIWQLRGTAGPVAGRPHHASTTWRAMWTALEGSLLLWVVLLMGFTAAVAWQIRNAPMTRWLAGRWW